MGNISPEDILNDVESHLNNTPEALFIKKIEALKIDPNEDIQPPQIAWEQVQEDDKTATLGTLGNFSVLIGKAKSRKSFLIVILVFIALSNKIWGKIRGCLPENKKAVLYIDTEQSRYHVQKAVKRICKLLGQQVPINLTVYGFRSLEPSERLKAIEHLIYNTPNLGLLVIDGIKDLINSINDESEATMIASRLLKWSEELNIHIITVLHQNKSDTNARGHIGTELINKAETVLSVTKDDNDREISIVEPQQCRNIEPLPFAFEIIEGLPCIAENFELRTESSKNKYDLTEIEPSKLWAMLTDVYCRGEKFNYSELVRQIKISFKDHFQKKIGDNRTKDLITEFKNKKWLIQEGSKTPYTLGKND